MGKPIGVADYQLIKGKSIAQFCFIYSKINPIVVLSRKKSYLCRQNGNSHNDDKKDKICQYKVKLPSKTDL